MEKNKNIITIIVVLVVLIVLAGLVWWYIQQRGSAQLQQTPSIMPSNGDQNIPPTPSIENIPFNNPSENSEVPSDSPSPTTE